MEKGFRDLGNCAKTEAKITPENTADEGVCTSQRSRAIVEKLLRDPGETSHPEESTSTTDECSPTPATSSPASMKVERILRDPEGMSEGKFIKRSSSNYKPKLKMFAGLAHEKKENVVSRQPRVDSFDVKNSTLEMLTENNVKIVEKTAMTVLQEKAPPNIVSKSNDSSVVSLAENMEDALSFNTKTKSAAISPTRKEEIFVGYPIFLMPPIGSIMYGRLIEVFPLSKDCQFTICDSSKTQLLNEIEQEMKQLYASDDLTMTYYQITGQLTPGCYGVFIPQWEKWVRCHLCKLIRPGREEFAVKIIDYETTMTVSRKNVRYLTKRFYALPQQSYKAKLHIACHDTLGSLQSHGKNQILGFHVKGAKTHEPSGFVILSLMLTCESKREQLMCK